MEPRQLKRLMQRTRAERDALLVEGLHALHEHVSALSRDLATLMESGGLRGAAVVGLAAEEEAAKILILLDLVRLGWNDEKACSVHLEKFANHLARGIYAEITGTKPGTFQDVQDWVERQRRSHYLDGPMDVDWSFRNDIETRREESIYVDFIMTDEGDRWITPASRDESSERWPTRVIELVLGLGKLGALSLSGIEALREAWNGVTIHPKMHWSEVNAINMKVLAQTSPDPPTVQLTRKEARALHESWTFPMHQLDMRKVEVTQAERKEQRNRWLNSQFE